MILLDQDSVEVGRSLTDHAGRFNLPVPGEGFYRLKSAVIGIKSTVSPQFAVTESQDLEVSFAVQAIVVVLPTLLVEDERTCGEAADASIVAATVWDEVRKALSAVRWTEERAMFRHALVRYERTLDPYSLEIRDEESWSQEGVYSGSPFETETPANLHVGGFIQRGETGYHYYGPDANLLLSDEFARAHCFSVREGDGERFGMIGLEFRPTSERDPADVAGVLWIDRSTAELRHLDFRYTRTPPGIDSPTIGGRVVFERLPDGPWIVQRWRIRMPVVRRRPARFSDFTSETYLAEIKESGGWVKEIRRLDGSAVGRMGGAMLAGTVVDLNTARPVRGATVVIAGSGLTATTDRAGRFRFERVPEGTHRIAFGRDVMDSLGFAPPPQVVTLSLDGPETVGLVIPKHTSLRSVLCPRSDPRAAGVGTVSGFVDDLSGNPLNAVQVIVFEDRPVAAQDAAVRVYGDAMTDWAGFYAVCDIPAGGSVVVEARLAGHNETSTKTATTRLTGGEIVRIDFALNTVER